MARPKSSSFQERYSVWKSFALHLQIGECRTVRKCGRQGPSWIRNPCASWKELGLTKLVKLRNCGRSPKNVSSGIFSHTGNLFVVVREAWPRGLSNSQGLLVFL